MLSVCIVYKCYLIAEAHCEKNSKQTTSCWFKFFIITLLLCETWNVLYFFDCVDTHIWSQKKYVEFPDYLYFDCTDFYMKQACITGSALSIYLFIVPNYFYLLKSTTNCFVRVLTVHLYSLISGQSFTEKRTRWGWRQLRRGKINQWINKWQSLFSFIHPTFKIFTCVHCQSIGQVIYSLTHCGSRLQKMCFCHLTLSGNTLWSVCLLGFFSVPHRDSASQHGCVFIPCPFLARNPPPTSTHFTTMCLCTLGR